MEDDCGLLDLVLVGALGYDTLALNLTEIY